VLYSGVRAPAAQVAVAGPPVEAFGLADPLWCV